MPADSAAAGDSPGGAAAELLLTGGGVRTLFRVRIYILYFYLGCLVPCSFWCLHTNVDLTRFLPGLYSIQPLLPSVQNCKE